MIADFLLVALLGAEAAAMKEVADFQRNHKKYSSVSLLEPFLESIKCVMT
jgi:hypothetical protein